MSEIKLKIFGVHVHINYGIEFVRLMILLIKKYMRIILCYCASINKPNGTPSAAKQDELLCYDTSIEIVFPTN